MGHGRTTLRSTAATAVSAALIAGTVVGLAPAAQADAPARPVVDHTGDGGTRLKGYVVTPPRADRSRRD
ncbi:acyl esterase, partial [Streptomyces sp. NPDC049099]